MLHKIQTQATEFRRRADATSVREIFYISCSFTPPYRATKLPHFNHHSNRTYKGKGKPSMDILPRKIMDEVVDTKEPKRPPTNPFLIATNSAVAAKHELEQRMKAFFGLGISFKSKAIRSATAFTVPAGGGSREVKRRQRQIAKGILKLGHN